MAKLLFDGRDNLVEGDGQRYVTLGNLTRRQAYQLADAVFGSGPGSELLKAVDGTYGRGEGTFIKRELAQASRDGALRFGREDGNPASGYQMGAFQDGGPQSTRAAALAQYEKNLKAGLALYAQIADVQVQVGAQYLSLADQDVIAHIGYIATELGGEATLRSLANPDLDDAKVAQLMSGTKDRMDAKGLDLVRMQYHLIVDTHGLGRPQTQSQSVVGLHSTGEDVNAIQRSVGAKVTGIYKRATRDAVCAFQTKHHLKPDGIVGPKTWDVLLRNERDRRVQREGRQPTPAQASPGTTEPNLGYVPLLNRLVLQLKDLLPGEKRGPTKPDEYPKVDRDAGKIEFNKYFTLLAPPGGRLLTLQVRDGSGTELSGTKYFHADADTPKWSAGIKHEGKLPKVGTDYFVSLTKDSTPHSGKGCLGVVSEPGGPGVQVCVNSNGHHALSLPEGKIEKCVDGIKKTKLCMTVTTGYGNPPAPPGQPRVPLVGPAGNPVASELRPGLFGTLQFDLTIP